MESPSNPLDLLSAKMCSPMMVYLVFVIITGISVFLTRSTLKRFNNAKMENLYNLFSLHEVKLVVVLGAILFGLCQYNQVNLAWIFLIFPIIYIILKNLIVFLPVSMAQQNAPKEIETIKPSMFESQVAQATNQPQQVHQQVQQHVEQQVNKEISGMSPPLNSGTPISGLSSMGGSPF
tara:strand:- start:751 stop:1284 length:534 start_codon:yes stop_codon:yes gene_type:complete